MGSAMPGISISAIVLLEAGEEGLELRATDLEVGIRSQHPADVPEAGRVTASAKKLYEIVRELPDEPVHLQTTDDAFGHS